MYNIIPDPDKLIYSKKTNKIVLFYFFKYSNRETNSIKIKKIFKDNEIKCLHWFNCEYTIIGQEDFWTSASIIEFKSKKHLKKIYHKKISNNKIKAFQIFNLKPNNPPKIILFIIKLLRPFGILIDLMVKNSIDSLKPNGKILPTKKQYLKLFNDNRKNKAYMINLLQSYKIAKYESSNNIISGKEAYYKKYGIVAIRSVILTGGNFTFAGKIIGNTLIEYNAPNDTKGIWESIGIMEYSKPNKLFSLEKMPGYKRALNHRNAGLKRTVNIFSVK
tara:strand:+ start:134 stop:958 length:825 start_codon:yes stop_codon:yes gene_type:complete